MNAIGMSKGAIYHHFESKEDILKEIGERSFRKRESYDGMSEQQNGLEKIKSFMRNEFSNYEKQMIDKFSAEIIKIPQFTCLLLETSKNQNAPMFQAMIEEGIRDGSIHVEDPKLVSEVFIMLTNIWANPMLWGYSQKEFLSRTIMIGEILAGLGLPIMDQEMKDTLIQYYKNATV